MQLPERMHAFISISVHLGYKQDDTLSHLDNALVGERLLCCYNLALHFSSHNSRILLV